MENKVLASGSTNNLTLEKWEARRSGAAITIRGAIALGPDKGTKVLASGVARIAPKDGEVVALDGDGGVIAVLSC